MSENPAANHSNNPDQQQRKFGTLHFRFGSQQPKYSATPSNQLLNNILSTSTNPSPSAGPQRPSVPPPPPQQQQQQQQHQVRNVMSFAKVALSSSSLSSSTPSVHNNHYFHHSSKVHLAAAFEKLQQQTQENEFLQKHGSMMFTLSPNINKLAWQSIFNQACEAASEVERPPDDDLTEVKIKLKRELEALAATIATRKRTALLRKRSLADYEMALRDLGDDVGAKKALELWKVLDETSATVNSNLQAIRDRFVKEHDETVNDSAENTSSVLQQQRLRHRQLQQENLYESQAEIALAASRGELTVEEAISVLYESEPREFLGKLLPFQEESLAFFLNMNSRGANGLNCDEMGLGKSVQSISCLVAQRQLKRLELISKLKKEAIAKRKMKGTSLEQLLQEANSMLAPSLFVVPLSTSSSWEQEFKTFAPSLRVGNYGTCPDRAAMLAQFFGERKSKAPQRRRRAKDDSDDEDDDDDDSDDEEDDDDDSDDDDEDDSDSSDKRRRLKNRLRAGARRNNNNNNNMKKNKSNNNNSIRKKQFGFDVLIMPHHYFSQIRAALAVKYLARLTKINWFYLVIDEAHRIKNDTAVLTATLQLFRCVEHRLVLTGTPLQNSLDELWTLLSFLLPEVFAKKQFAALFRAIADLHAIPNFSSAIANRKKDDEQARALAEERQFLLCRKIHDVLLPLMVRREKKDVIQELPQLTEWYVVCPNAALQQYEAQLFLTKNAESASLLSRGEEEEQDEPLSIFCERRLALHPFMLRVVQDMKRSLCDEQVQQDLFKGSGKFIILDLFLKFVFAYNQKVLSHRGGGDGGGGDDGDDEGFHHQHKILIFSQFATLLEMVETHVGWCRNWPYLKLDGSTQDRPSLINEFKSNDEQFIFLLTKGAGGVGLNLQAADTVILLDIDYNPTLDQQSLSRAYRVGQQKDVLVLKLISDFAAEKSIMEKASRKQDLENKIISAGRFDIKTVDDDRDRALREQMKKNDENYDSNDDEERCHVSRMNKINMTKKEDIRSVLKRELLRVFPRTKFERTFLEGLIDDGEEKFLDEAVDALMYKSKSLLLPEGARWKSGTMDLTADFAKRAQQELLAPRAARAAAEKHFDERRRKIEAGEIDEDDDDDYVDG